MRVSERAGRGPRTPASRAALLALAAAAAVCGGCVNLTIFQTSMGHSIDPAAVARIQPGRSDLAEVLSLLGAPIEVHFHPDGRLLIYRARGMTSIEFGVSAGNVTMAVDVARTFSWILDLLSFNYVSTQTDEDRVAVIFDRKGVVAGVAYRGKIRELPLF